MSEERPSEGDTGDLPDYSAVFRSNMIALLGEITDLKDKLRNAGDALDQGEGDVKQIKHLLKDDVPSLIKLAMEQEGRTYDTVNARSGKAGEFALDLGQARSEIGRRLDLLTDARKAEGVSDGVAGP